MKLYLGTPGWGWRMWGLIGKNSKWFLGFSKQAVYQDYEQPPGIHNYMSFDESSER